MMMSMDYCRGAGKLPLSEISLSFLLDLQHVINLFFFREFLQQNSEVPWLALTAEGFNELPVVFEKMERSSNSDQENITSVVLFRNGHSWFDCRTVRTEQALV